uniref:Uncharacterized protein n=1 Tax=Arundo donax TaxID=35708 RepID=A0A0A9AZC6_ARUDO
MDDDSLGGAWESGSFCFILSFAKIIFSMLVPSQNKVIQAVCDKLVVFLGCRAVV